MRKKILFLITKSNFGGAQRYVYELATNLPKDQYEVVVAFGGQGILKDKLEAAGVRTREIQSFQRDISIQKELRSLFELRQIYKEEQPDIIHLNSSKAVAMGALVGRLTGVPHIVSTVHGWAFLEPRSFLWRSIVWLGQWISTWLSDDVILVSAHDKSVRMPFQSRKLHMIHTALPKITFKERDVARDALFPQDTKETHQQDIWLVTNAELTHNKNLFAALDAVADFNDRNEWKIFYTIISDGELRSQLQEHIELRSLKDQVVLLGYVDDARSYLKAFDIFLLPSKKEGLPYALLEAGAAGLPAIASNVGGIPEVITNREYGLLIDPTDDATITKALEMFAFDPKLRATASANLEAKIAREYALPKMIEMTERVYER